MKEGQLAELILNETDEGLIGLEVDGLDLDLPEGLPLKIETQKMPRESSGDPLCASFRRPVETLSLIHI